MFDVKLPIEMNASTADGMRHLQMRWPSDHEWDTRQRARKHIMRSLGRGRFVTENPLPGPHDLELYNAIKQNGAGDLTVGEAEFVINILGQCDVTNVIVEGNQATVEMSVPSGNVTHHLRLPSIDQIQSFRRTASKTIELPHGVSEIRTTIMPGAQIYDACGGRSDDYAGGVVPALHKDAAVRLTIAHIQTEFGPRKDDENF